MCLQTIERGSEEFLEEMFEVENVHNSEVCEILTPPLVRCRRIWACGGGWVWAMACMAWTSSASRAAVAAWADANARSSIATRDSCASRRMALAN